MNVCEIFRSIQGESYLMGLPCTFVRVAGCNLRCSWCDTKYAWEASAGTEMTVEEVLSKVYELGADLVEITGGEPLLDADAVPLMRTLCDNGSRVLLETNGTQDVSDVDSRVTIVMDVKAPSSGHERSTRWENLEKLQDSDEIKVVIADRADYDWAKKTLADKKVLGAHRVTFSPVYGRLDYRAVAEWILADNIPVKLGIQLHKLLWGPDARGV